MDLHRIPKRILEIKMSGRRPRRRPYTRWIDQVKRDVERREQDWRRADEMQEWEDRDS
jgi:hypothetical protein